MFQSAPYVTFAQSNTMDASTNDSTPTGSALLCGRGVIPNVKFNNNTREAVDSLLAGAPARETMLIYGHGNSGYIKTGNGNQGGSSDQYLANYNSAYWIPQVRRIYGRCSDLTLLGCDVGSNPEGAQLLYYLAQILNCPVHGPTYLVWCETGHGIYLDMRAQWQTATPSGQPTPIPKPSGLFIRVDTYTLYISGTRHMHTINSISYAALALRPLHRDHRGLSGLEITSDIAEMFDLANPIEKGATPSAMLTGDVWLHIKTETGTVEKHLILLNDSLLQDPENKHVYYRTSERFRQLVSEHRSNLNPWNNIRRRGKLAVPSNDKLISLFRAPSGTITSLSIGFLYCDGDPSKDSNWYSSSYLFSDKIPMSVGIELIVSDELVGKDAGIKVAVQDPFTNAELCTLSMGTLKITDTDNTWTTDWIQFEPPGLPQIPKGNVKVAYSVEVVQADPVSASGTFTFPCATFLYKDAATFLRGKWKGTAGSPFANQSTILVEFVVSGGNIIANISGDTTGSLSAIRMRSDGVFDAQISIFGFSGHIQAHSTKQRPL